MRDINWSRERIEAGGQLIRPQQNNASVYYLYRGWAYRYRSTTNGDNQIVSILLPGDVVGVDLNEGRLARAGVTALTDLEVGIVSRSGLKKAAASNPDFSLYVMDLIDREHQLTESLLLSIATRDAQQRLAWLIADIYSRLKLTASEEAGARTWPLTQGQISNVVGLSLVHTNKTLQKLADQGLIEVVRGFICPTDLDRLIAFSEGLTTPQIQKRWGRG